MMLMVVAEMAMVAMMMMMMMMVMVLVLVMMLTILLLLLLLKLKLLLMGRRRKRISGQLIIAALVLLLLLLFFARLKHQRIGFAEAALPAGRVALDADALGVPVAVVAQGAAVEAHNHARQVVRAEARQRVVHQHLGRGLWVVDVAH
jgi:type IV secretory pathway TrbL component